MKVGNVSGQLLRVIRPKKNCMYVNGSKISWAARHTHNSLYAQGVYNTVPFIDTIRERCGNHTVSLLGWRGAILDFLSSPSRAVDAVCGGVRDIRLPYTINHSCRLRLITGNNITDNCFNILTIQNLTTVLETQEKTDAKWHKIRRECFKT